MPTRIRLQRKGKKGQPFYHVVVADGRAPRDGKFIERLGTYNPMTHPATIDINFERALHWVQVGAQPSDTARSLLSHKGVFLKYHLLKGVEKGALTEEQVDVKFNAWLEEKENKINQAAKDKELTKKELHKKRLEDEKRIDEARAAELAKKRQVEQRRETSARDAAVQQDEAEQATAAEAAEAPKVPEAAEVPKAAEAPEAPAPEQTEESTTPEA